MLIATWSVESVVRAMVTGACGGLFCALPAKVAIPEVDANGQWIEIFLIQHPQNNWVKSLFRDGCDPWLTRQFPEGTS